MQEFFYLTYTLHTPYIFTQYILECYIIYYCLQKRFACGDCLVPRLHFITLCGTTIQYGISLFDLHTIFTLYTYTVYIGMLYNLLLFTKAFCMWRLSSHERFVYHTVRTTIRPLKSTYAGIFLFDLHT